jgi:putative ATP-dependent endonuclease of the OLD family
VYIAKIRLQNYRCFRDTSIDFQPGLNVIIGENNGGKTTLLRGLTLVFDRKGRSRPTIHDFYCLITPIDQPPTVTIGVTIRSSDHDCTADRAVVASWLTQLAPKWEAQLTYAFFLPEQHHEEFRAAVAGTGRPRFFEILEEFLPKFVARIYGGNPESKIVADGDSLSKFDCQFLDALRDVDAEMFSGSTPLFRNMLEQVLDFGANPAERRILKQDFRAKTSALGLELVTRLATDKLFHLAKDTGAADGGTPTLHGAFGESDLIAALRLFVDRQAFSFPATHNGLGYNNLLYISLVLASLSFRTSTDRLGENAAVFPMLLIEEPEAHLHPALQSKLLAHIKKRVEAEPRQNRQVFITTHSTHITAAAGLSPIIVLSVTESGRTHTAYPGKLFPQSKDGQKSRGYVERYLDATKSTMLFAKATLFVEGIAEQLVMPAIARLLGRPFEEHHVALVRVDGLTFKHFLPLFGVACDTDSAAHALPKRVACLVDADPARCEKTPGARRKSCWPFQLDVEPGKFDYFHESGTVNTLRSLITGSFDFHLSTLCTYLVSTALDRVHKAEFLTVLHAETGHTFGLETLDKTMLDGVIRKHCIIESVDEFNRFLERICKDLDHDNQLRTYKTTINGCAAASVHSGTKTFEYDVALEHPGNVLMIVDGKPNDPVLNTFAADLHSVPESLDALLEAEAKADLARIPDADTRNRIRYAAIYLQTIGDGKGENALALQRHLRDIDPAQHDFKCPSHIREAIEWVTPLIS